MSAAAAGSATRRAKLNGPVVGPLRGSTWGPAPTAQNTVAEVQEDPPVHQRGRNDVSLYVGHIQSYMFWYMSPIYDFS